MKSTRFKKGKSIVKDHVAIQSKFSRSIASDNRDEKNTNKKKKQDKTNVSNQNPIERYFLQEDDDDSEDEIIIKTNRNQVKKGNNKRTKRSKDIKESSDSDKQDEKDFDELNISSNNSSSDSDFVPNESEDEEKDLKLFQKKQSRKIALSSEDLKIKNQKERIKSDPSLKDLLSIVIDPEDETTKEKYKNLISIEALQNTTKAIRELDLLSKTKPTRQNKSTSSSIQSDSLLKDHFASFEEALQDLPESFNIPKAGVYQQKHSTSKNDSIVDDDDDINLENEEIAFDKLTEVIINMKDKTIERTGQNLITEISDVPFRSRKSEEEMLREPLEFERPCINGEKCESLYIGKSTGRSGFIMVEYPSSQDMTYFNKNGRWPRVPPSQNIINSFFRNNCQWPKDDPDPVKPTKEELEYLIQHREWPYTGPQKCVVCSRKEMHDLWINDLSYSSLRKEGDSSREIASCSEALYYNKIGPGEYSPSDVFMTDSNRINGNLLPIVMHSRCKYTLVKRKHTSGKMLNYYNQIMTCPSSFRVGRTQA